jgi:hypothetical protein
MHVYPFKDEGSDRIRSQVFDKRAATEAPASSTSGQSAIQFKDEGSNLGSSGGVTSVDFVGAGVTATETGGAVTVTIAGGGASVPTVTLDSANKHADLTLSGGDLTVTKSAAGSAHRMVRGTLGKFSGKWYFEVRVNTDTPGSRLYFVGLSDVDDPLTNHVGQSALSVGIYGNAGEVYRSAGSAGSFGSYTVGDVIGVAYCADSGKVWFAKNNTWLNSGDPANDKARMLADNKAGWRPAISIYEGSSGVSLTARFKTSDFSYTPPTGFSAWGT